VVLGAVNNLSASRFFLENSLIPLPPRAGVKLSLIGLYLWVDWTPFH
jgi:hypothetical protein